MEQRKSTCCHRFENQTKIPHTRHNITQFDFSRRKIARRTGTSAYSNNDLPTLPAALARSAAHAVTRRIRQPSSWRWATAPRAHPAHSPAVVMPSASGIAWTRLFGSPQIKFSAEGVGSDDAAATLPRLNFRSERFECATCHTTDNCFLENMEIRFLPSITEHYFCHLTHAAWHVRSRDRLESA